MEFRLPIRGKALCIIMGFSVLFSWGSMGFPMMFKINRTSQQNQPKIKSNWNVTGLVAPQRWKAPQRPLPGPADTAERYLRLIEMGVTGLLSDDDSKCDGGPSGCDICNPKKPDGLRIQPMRKEDRELGNDWPPFGHTMVGSRRLWNIRFAIEEVVKDNVPGDFAELGVWRGGSCIYARAVLNILGQPSRQVHVFDAFEAINDYGGASSFIGVSMQQVRRNFEKYGLLDSTVRFHKGLFKDSLPPFRADHSGQQLAVLRIDANMYSSYQDAMYYLYPLVPEGGIVIFDDVMSHKEVMTFWRDFKKDQGLSAMLHQIDDHSAWFRKTSIDEIKWTSYKNQSQIERAGAGGWR